METSKHRTRGSQTNVRLANIAKVATWQRLVQTATCLITHDKEMLSGREDFVNCSNELSNAKLPVCPPPPPTSHLQTGGQVKMTGDLHFCGFIGQAFTYIYMHYL